MNLKEFQKEYSNCLACGNAFYLDDKYKLHSGVHFTCNCKLDPYNVRASFQEELIIGRFYILNMKFFIVGSGCETNNIQNSTVYFEDKKIKCENVEQYYKMLYKHVAPDIKKAKDKMNDTFNKILLLS